jgi:threonine dehydrogenase-like Zn-dependent dehydrogenase
MAANMTAMMRAVTQFGQALIIAVVDIPVPAILNATDVIVRINMNAICGSDLHTYHVESGSPQQPLYYRHEAMGYVTKVGNAMQFLSVGDYVVIPDNLDNGHYTRSLRFMTRLWDSVDLWARCFLDFKVSIPSNPLRYPLSSLLKLLLS